MTPDLLRDYRRIELACTRFGPVRGTMISAKSCVFCDGKHHTATEPHHAPGCPLRRVRERLERGGEDR